MSDLDAAYRDGHTTAEKYARLDACTRARDEWSRRGTRG
jgi:hypothetical protein